MPNGINLPALTDEQAGYLTLLTTALGIPREVLAEDEEIRRAWEQLPRMLSQIPHDRLSELHARMCVAVSTGLFDAAINYIWNSAVIALRDKVRAFGIHVVPQIVEGPFDEDRLLDLTDFELIELCHSLNLISVDARFFLNQAREVRNNFSTAHPPMGALNDAEFLVFLDRCVRYALTETANPTGVDTRALIDAVRAQRHNEAQRDAWVGRVAATHEAQRQLIIGMLHGIYCDPASTVTTKANALGICQAFAAELPAKVRSDLLNRHSDYVAKGDADRVRASQEFFTELGLIALLNEQERHSIITGAAADLVRVHHEWNNFYNEPPFAKRMAEISHQGNIPETARIEFVDAVVTCGIGNQYGVSHAAVEYYREMVRGFGPDEIRLMLRPQRVDSVIGNRLRTNAACRARFRELVALVDPESVPQDALRQYQTWRAEE